MDDIKLVEIVKKSIKEELINYGTQLQEEMTEKFQKEFNRKLELKKSELVARAAETIRIESSLDPQQMNINLYIKF